VKTQIYPDCTVEFADTGQGKPVVLLHAFPLSRVMWRTQVDAVSGICRLITPDLRGFGGTSPFDGPPSVERMADDIQALLDKLKIQEPVAVGGLSMGGYVALAFARKYADRLRGLILADTRAEADTADGRANRDQMINFARMHTAADVIEQMLPNMVRTKPVTTSRRC